MLGTRAPRTAGGSPPRMLVYLLVLRLVLVLGFMTHPHISNVRDLHVYSSCLACSSPQTARISARLKRAERTIECGHEQLLGSCLQLCQQLVG